MLRSRPGAWKQRRGTRSLKGTTGRRWTSRRPRSARLHAAALRESRPPPRRGAHGRSWGSAGGPGTPCAGLSASSRRCPRRTSLSTTTGTTRTSNWRTPLRPWHGSATRPPSTARAPSWRGSTGVPVPGAPPPPGSTWPWRSRRPDAQMRLRDRRSRRLRPGGSCRPTPGGSPRSSEPWRAPACRRPPSYGRRTRAWSPRTVADRCGVTEPGAQPLVQRDMAMCRCWSEGTPMSPRLGVRVLAGVLVAAGGMAVFIGRPAMSQAASTRYEAESATISQGVVATNHPGFTGIGFVDYTNVAGSYVQFPVTIPATGTATLTFRYANGSTASRPMDVAVNGTVVAAAVAFPPTANWDTWQTVSVTATVSGGTNIVRATATTSGGGPNLDSLTVGSTAVDWSVALVESTMTRFTPGTLGGWSYPQGLYLYGQYLVYQRTHDARYLSYLKAWVDRFVDSTGALSPTLSSLDSMLSGRLLVILARETGDPRYQTAAATIRNRLNNYPRTTDGGFWHADTSSRAHQLWSDGTFMVNPFLAEYGQQFNDSTYANDETAHQLEVYASHLQQSNGLMRHAYD